MQPKSQITLLLFVVCFAISSLSMAQEKSSKPNILVIWGDDIGYWNLSTNNDGMMGYQTPIIDSIADQGAKFTDAYSANFTGTHTLQ